MRHVVSIGPGSSTRNHRVETDLLGRRIVIERIGTDGDVGRANALMRELDGRVDAFGLANIDLYISDGTRTHLVRDAARIVHGVTRTPVVDGGGLKDAWERWLITDYLPRQRGISFCDRRVLMPVAVGRFGMAEAFLDEGAELIFGDLMFGLGLPVALRSLRLVKMLAALLLPALCQVPIRLLYPVGRQQVEIIPRHGRYYAWADVIAGDFHYIRRHLPADLRRKTILTQTTTPADVEELRRRGLRILITDFQPMAGRTFATNVLQAVAVALLEKPPAAIQAQEYVATLRNAGIEPSIVQLNPV